MICSKCNQSFESLTDQGLCAGCFQKAEARRVGIIELARQHRQVEGAVEIDNNAQLSEGNDNGCYVSAWVWVDFAGTGYDKESHQKEKPMNDSKKPNEPKDHAFSPHTDLCINCGKSAQDDAIENTACGSDQPTKCQTCKGKGWFFFNTGSDQGHKYEIQRCDVCEQFDSDLAALEALEKAGLTQPALLRFVERVAGLKREGEPGDDGPFERTSEDSIATLNQLILEARQLLGTAETCGKCGQTVPYVIVCLGGAEICQQCFDAGKD